MGSLRLGCAHLKIMIVNSIWNNEHVMKSTKIFSWTAAKEMLQFIYICHFKKIICFIYLKLDICEGEEVFTIF